MKRWLWSLISSNSSCFAIAICDAPTRTKSSIFSDFTYPNWKTTVIKKRRNNCNSTICPNFSHAFASSTCLQKRSYNSAWTLSFGIRMRLFAPCVNDWPRRNQPDCPRNFWWEMRAKKCKKGGITQEISKKLLLRQLRSSLSSSANQLLSSSQLPKIRKPLIPKTLWRIRRRSSDAMP